MNKSILLILIVVTFIGCNGPTQEEYNRLKTENIKLKSELSESQKKIDKLSNTPEMRLAKGIKYQSGNNLVQAKTEFSKLIKVFPGTEEAKKASVRLKEIIAKEKAVKKEEERKKALGFKILKNDYKIKIGKVIMNITRIDYRNRWIFDSYKNEYHYRDAERGEKYIVARVSISSEIKTPKLPPICAYKLTNGKLYLLGIFEYKFRHWKDYGAYLGNYADYGNSFAHTKTIRFTCGFQISNENIENNAIFIVAKNSNCFYRHERSFDNPPISYEKLDCKPKGVLSLNDFDKNYTLIKMFNRNKL